jgi:hypothetical protein
MWGRVLTAGQCEVRKSSWVWRYKLGTPVFGEFILLFSADPLKLCRAGWGESLQLFSGLSREVRSGSSPGSGWATQGHSESRSTPALSWLCLGSFPSWKVNCCPSLRSWALWNRFSSGISIHSPQICALTQSSLGALRTFLRPDIGVRLSKSCPIYWSYRWWTSIKL